MKTTYLFNILSLGLFISFLSCNNEDKARVQAKTTSPINVTVEKATSTNNDGSLIVSGTVQAANSAKLSTRVMGYVEKINVNVGDKVNKGQLLLSINSSDLAAKRAQVNARILEATAAYENAKKDYERFQNLFNQNSASQKELDDMSARFNMAEARLQSTKELKKEIDAQFTYTNIRAPFDGIIASKLIDVGTLANPGMPLLLVESPDEFEVVAKIPESAIASIKRGTEVGLTISAIETNIKGLVKEVSSSSSLSGGQYLVTIGISESNKNIRSGMFASVQFPTISSDSNGSVSSILIPKEVIIRRGQLTGLFTVSQQNTAVLRWLRLGNTTGEYVEVLSGLKRGETYITSSQEKLYNGAPLNVQLNQD